FQLLPTLLKAGENRKHPHAEIVLDTISRLTDLLFHELAEWAINPSGVKQDPSFARHQVLAALEQSLSRYATHERLAILDAFLLPPPLDNPTFLRILRDPQHACHMDMLRALSTSQDFGVIERLVELLRDTETPTAALEIIASRGDDAFLRILLH